jgi:FixJ family two-component response regulator
MIEDTSLISIVDDDSFVRGGIGNLLLSLGYNVLTFASAEALLASDFADRTSCLISDIRMPGMNGLDLQKHLKEEGRCPPVIFITAHFCEKARSQAFEAGAVAYFSKPFSENMLIDCINKTLANHRRTPSPCLRSAIQTGRSSLFPLQPRPKSVRCGRQ